MLKHAHTTQKNCACHQEAGSARSPRMGNLFGKREANPSGGAGISEHDRAVLELKRQRDRLKKYQLQIGKVIER